MIKIYFNLSGYIFVNNIFVSIRLYERENHCYRVLIYIDYILLMDIYYIQQIQFYINY